MKKRELTQEDTKKLSGNCGRLYVTVNYYDKKTYEVFTNIEYAGCRWAKVKHLVRVVSYLLHFGVLRMV